MGGHLQIRWWRMINSIQLLRNIGLFDSVSAGANISLARLTLVYAESGRGKTKLAAILRSLATGDPIPIAERRRLAAQHPRMLFWTATAALRRRCSRIMPPPATALPHPLR